MAARMLLSRVKLDAVFPRLMATKADFEKAKSQLLRLTKEPTNEEKLRIYALFKQSTEGHCTTPKPSAFNFVNKVKWEAWNQLGDLTQDDAQEQYIKMVDKLNATETETVPSPELHVQETDYETLVLTKQNNMTTIRLNRPSRKNAINVQMYHDIMRALGEAKDDDSTLVVFTGTGDYYCSGNDLENFNIPLDHMETVAQESSLLLKKFVATFIDFPKPLVGMINGPAVGISVTILGLFDLVYAADSATFHTPFTKLGQSPEGCSSYTFPKIMGIPKASELLLFNKKISAREAYDLNLVTEVFPTNTFEREAWHRLQNYATLPNKALHLSRQLLHQLKRETLHKTNEAECQLLKQMWLSPECASAIATFFQRKTSKL
uniref:enoyl-CoA delta isomerase 2 isoform X1 n=2 Tax=Myxine glutinosa TaxID=7769 RepID=UPI00358F13AA